MCFSFASKTKYRFLASIAFFRMVVLQSEIGWIRQIGSEIRRSASEQLRSGLRTHNQLVKERAGHQFCKRNEKGI